MDLRTLPKVVLHDHLDGGVRPATLIELAPAVGYRDLPSMDPDELARALYQGMAESLEDYLDAFRHTFGVMQTPEAMRRVAFECVEDHAAEGVVYAEIRFAPSLHMRAGMTRGEAIENVVAGLSDAERQFGVASGVIVDILRQDSDSLEVAEAAVEYAGRGVVAIDLAGPEAAHPAPLFERAIDMAREGGLRVTIHAGEGAGVESIAGALSMGAERLGHGARIVEDTEVVGGKIVSMGPVASEVYQRGITLELCPTSNLHTKMYPTAADHPIGMLHHAGFAATVNTDNRLMSGITMTDEFEFVSAHQEFTPEDLHAVTLNAIEAAFCSEETRARVKALVDAGYRSQ
ncbi:MAG TPA: adenosine deaminase [Acidimicrobiia bacterium]|nr:adenosine deaminase [Acidimicrobiia bacterium]